MMTEAHTTPALVDLSDPGFWDDPHPILRAAREHCPVAVTDSGDRMLLRHADVRALLADRRVISNALALITRLVEEGPLVDWWRGMLTNLNGPEHDRLRRLVARAFTPRSVDRERPRIRRLTREILARHADAGEIDLFHSWADELPIRLICGLLGFDQAHHDDLARWSTDLGQVISAVMTPELRCAGEDAVVNLNGFISQALAERRRAPRDDLLSALIRAADDFDEPVSEGDLVTLVVNLLFGGHDTSRSMLAVTMLLLLQHPDQLAKLRGDASLMARAGEEALRFEPIIIWAAREPTEDLEVAGIALPAGEPVMLSILAANRDPEVFDAPDRFDITRTSKSSVSFGWGPHICLGAHLARAELEEAIPELLRTCEHIEFAGDEPRWLPHGFIRRLDQLRVRFRPSAGAFAG
jgi:cytochrome P450